MFDACQGRRDEEANIDHKDKALECLERGCIIGGNSNKVPSPLRTSMKVKRTLEGKAGVVIKQGSSFLCKG